MTAEIAVLNKLAVALAADSAVSIGEPQREKIYYTVNKLFALSKYRPVGIMVYGQAEFMETPWETAIKLYRARLGTRGFDTLHDYWVDFVTFLRDEPALSNAQREREEVESYVTGFLGLVRTEIDQLVGREIQARGQLTEPEIIGIVMRKLAEEATKMQQNPPLSHLSPDFEGTALHLHQEAIRKAVAQVFARLPMPAEATPLIDVIVGGLLSRSIFPEQVSGVVVAGYGESELYPVLEEYSVQSRVAGQVRYQEGKRVVISHGVTAAVVPFAQHEMVNTFMEGIEPNYARWIRGYMHQLFQDYPEHIVKELAALSEQERDAFVARWRAAGAQLVEDFEKKTDAFTRKFFVVPVISAITSLPKDELALMAETLVSLTSFKRKVSMSSETVGGPIDVAVVSKGDGLVWIRRKHYFQPALNPSFFANYYGISGSTGAQP